MAFIYGMPGWTGLPGTDELVAVANSFSEYLAKLYISESDARYMIKHAKERKDVEALSYIRAYLDVGMPDWRRRLGVDAIGV